jgi:hypothetical protein
VILLLAQLEEKKLKCTSAAATPQIPTGYAQTGSLESEPQVGYLEMDAIPNGELVGKMEGLTRGSDEPHTSVEVNKEESKRYSIPSYLDPVSGKMLKFRVWSTARPHMRAFHFGKLIFICEKAQRMFETHQQKPGLTHALPQHG